MACGYLSSLTCDRTYTPCSRSMGPPGKQLDLQGSPSLYFILAFWLRSSGGSDRKRLSTMRETWVQPLGREVPGEGNGNPLQYSCLENPMDGGAWCPWGRKELDTTERLHFFFFQKEHSPTHTWILAQTPILDFGPLEVSASAFVLF